MKRRRFLASGTVLFAFLSVWPKRVMAEWSTKSFERSTLDTAFMNALGTRELVKSDAITIVAPPVASDSSAVPVEVISSIKGEDLYLFVEKNITPLVFKCRLYGSAHTDFALNIKMKESSALYAVVKAGTKYFMATVNVEVQAQAC